MKFYKYHGLGNDYLVMDPADGITVPDPSRIRTICHRNFGMGSDGILFGPNKTQAADFALRIFNPDGSEAEKSGNGLRIFARYLFDRGRVGHEPFSISTIGGIVKAQVHPDMMITVDMGTVRFDSESIPVAGPMREVLEDKLTIDGQEIIYSAATIGNPHCVVIADAISPELAKTLGPKLETHPNFPNKTNVQFMRVMDRANIALEIWERGAGYTLASGSSSSAAAAVAYRLGLTDPDITVHMPGGKLSIRVEKDFFVRLKGPVVRVGEGTMDAEIFRQENLK